MARKRDPRTGDVARPPLVYVLVVSGVLAFATISGLETLVGLAGRL